MFAWARTYFADSNKSGDNDTNRRPLGIIDKYTPLGFLRCRTNGRQRLMCGRSDWTKNPLGTAPRANEHFLGHERRRVLRTFISDVPQISTWKRRLRLRFCPIVIKDPLYDICDSELQVLFGSLLWHDEYKHLNSPGLRVVCHESKS